MILIILIANIIMARIAYPFNKRWRMEVEEDFMRIDMFMCMFTSFFLWWIVLPWKFFKMGVIGARFIDWLTTPVEEKDKITAKY